MRLIDKKTLKQFAGSHPAAAAALGKWYQAAKVANWANLREVRSVYPHADLVKVASGNIVTVFNVAGNNFRLITAIHYNTQVIYLMPVLTHAEYSKNKWKGVL